MAKQSIFLIHKSTSTQMNEWAKHNCFQIRNMFNGLTSFFPDLFYCVQFAVSVLMKFGEFIIRLNQKRTNSTQK